MRVNLYISYVDPVGTARGYFLGETSSICINSNIEEIKNTPVEFYGHTKKSVIDQVIAALRARGLSGSLHIV